MQWPFTQDEFQGVFAAYNAAMWPLQLIAVLLGLLAVALLFLNAAWSNRAISLILAAFWFLMAVGDHWLHFSAINPLACLFAGLFILAAVMFMVEGMMRNRIEFGQRSGVRGWMAAILLLYAIAAYPPLGLFVTDPYPETPLFGVAPCPNTPPPESRFPIR